MPTLAMDEHKFIEQVASRLYTGRIQEILGELLQNSQRAGATRVQFSFPSPTTCVYEDDGHGLEHGIDDLRRLLVLAESHFRDPSVAENQKPMGVGFFAVLVHEGIAHLTIESNALLLEIDTHLWVHEREYWADWEGRVVVRDQGTTPGFRLIIEGREDILAQMQHCLTQGNSVSDLCVAQNFQTRYNPVGGYSDFFNVSLEGKAITVSLPWEISLPRPDITAEYLGNTLRITLSPNDYPYYSGLMTNFFGQIIPDYGFWRGLRVYLIVRQGHPVTPLAPTRTSLIQDEALQALRTFIEDQIFSWVCRQEKPSAKYVKRLYELYPDRAERECPFSVIQAWKPLPDDYQFTSNRAYREAECHNPTCESDERGPETVVLKSTLSSYLFLDERVTCLLPKSHPAQPYDIRKEVREDPTRESDKNPVECAIGLTSLLAATSITAHTACVGVPKANISRFWWRPGAVVDTYHTTDLGMWTIQQGSDTKTIPLPEEWAPLLGEAFVAQEKGSDAFEEINWVIGLHQTDHMIPFLHLRANAAFEPDEDEEEVSAEFYDASVHTLLCRYLPNTVNRDTLLVEFPAEAKRLLPPEYHAVEATLQFVLEEEAIRGVRLTFADGYTKEVNVR